MQPRVSFLEGDAKPSFVSVHSEDLEVLARATKETCNRGQWTQLVEPGGTVTYCSLKLREGSVVQLIHVNKELRRVIIDLGSDGFVDFKLWDSDQDGEPDRRVTWDRPVPAREWVGNHSERTDQPSPKGSNQRQRAS